MATNQESQDSSSAAAGGMGFLAHLIELRDRLLRMVLVLGVVFIILFPFAQDLYEWLAAPVLNQTSAGMIATGPIAPVFIPYKVALLAAFLISLPYIFYQMWSFIAPGLYKHEKRLVVPLIVSSVTLFYTGIAFAYYLLLPMIFKVVQAMTPEGVAAMPDISAYLDFVMMIFIAFGFGFEMPIATILIISTGMISAKELGKKRPYVVVGAFVIGMLLTPPDIISQIMLAIPMWLLFELGLFLSRFFKQELKAAGKAREEVDRLERDKMDKEDADAAKLAAGSSVAAATAAAATSSDSSADDAPMWEDDKYTYEDDNDVNLDDEDYVPLTEEEMDAELDRIEAEEAEQDARDRNTSKPSPSADEGNADADSSQNNNKDTKSK
ncbi:MAG: Twin-arginine translocation protein TatC [uncultured Thiotrichaceae bacterium]|uniref:Sec-independent protein translocase protein TatC n=1 Tax=uncultured Thiotrichaceae bacterium TaxID=298394 RepID=A0A6S6TB13_9GAMM|nr:MAG: Twin-arginine translocation protein TatC [uncultured Thiotrichaceae bacterium]